MFWHLLYTQLRAPKPHCWRALGRARESWERQGIAHLFSPHRPSQAKPTHIAESLFTLLCPPLAPSSLFCNLSGTSPSGLSLWLQCLHSSTLPWASGEQPVWVSARHSWPSWSGLPSGTELAEVSYCSPPTPVPPWRCAGFTWGRPKRVPTQSTPSHSCGIRR